MSGFTMPRPMPPHSARMAAALVLAASLGYATAARISLGEEHKDPPKLGELIPNTDAIVIKGVACETLSAMNHKHLLTKIPANVYSFITSRSLESEYLGLVADVLKSDTTTLGLWKASSIYRAMFLNDHLKAFKSKKVSVYLTKKHMHGSQLPSTFNLCYVDDEEQPGYKLPHVYSYSKEKLRALDECKAGESMGVAEAAAAKAGGQKNGEGCLKVAGAAAREEFGFPMCKCGKGQVVFCGMHQISKHRKFDMQRVLARDECHPFAEIGFSITECGEEGLVGEYRATLGPVNNTIFRKGGSLSKKVRHSTSMKAWVVRKEQKYLYWSLNESKTVPLDGWQSSQCYRPGQVLPNMLSRALAGQGYGPPRITTGVVVNFDVVNSSLAIVNGKWAARGEHLGHTVYQKTDISIGSRVAEVQFGGKTARVVGDAGDGKFEVAWEDGTEQDTIKRVEELRLIDPPTISMIGGAVTKTWGIRMHDMDGKPVLFEARTTTDAIPAAGWVPARGPTRPTIVPDPEMFEMVGANSWNRANGLWQSKGTSGGRPMYVLATDTSGTMYWQAPAREWRVYFQDMTNSPTLYRSRVDSKSAPTSGWELVKTAVGPTIERRDGTFAIRDCGIGRANGEWKKEFQMWHGRPWYTRVGDPNVLIYWHAPASQWCLGFRDMYDQAVIYKSPEQSDTVPASGWVAVRDLASHVPVVVKVEDTVTVEDGSYPWAIGTWTSSVIVNDRPYYTRGATGRIYWKREAKEWRLEQQVEFIIHGCSEPRVNGAWVKVADRNAMYRHVEDPNVILYKRVAYESEWRIYFNDMQGQPTLFRSVATSDRLPTIGWYHAFNPYAKPPVIVKGMTTVLFRSNADTHYAPTVGWEAVRGSGPVPRFLSTSPFAVQGSVDERLKGTWEYDSMVDGHPKFTRVNDKRAVISFAASGLGGMWHMRYEGTKVAFKSEYMTVKTGWQMIDDVPTLQSVPRGFTVTRCGLREFKGHWKHVSAGDDDGHARYLLEGGGASGATVAWDPETAAWQLRLGEETMYRSPVPPMEARVDDWAFTHEFAPPEIRLPEHLPIKVQAKFKEEADGVWEYDYEVAGRPRYVIGDGLVGQIEWVEEAREWQMSFMGQELVYHSTEDSPGVPEGGWQCLRGPSPPKFSVPTLAEAGSTAYCAKRACEEDDDDS